MACQSYTVKPGLLLLSTCGGTSDYLRLTHYRSSDSKCVDDEVDSTVEVLPSKRAPAMRKCPVSPSFGRQADALYDMLHHECNQLSLVKSTPIKLDRLAEINHKRP